MAIPSPLDSSPPSKTALKWADRTHRYVWNNTGRNFGTWPRAFEIDYDAVEAALQLWKMPPIPVLLTDNPDPFGIRIGGYYNHERVEVRVGENISDVELASACIWHELRHAYQVRYWYDGNAFKFAIEYHQARSNKVHHRRDWVGYASIPHEADAFAAMENHFVQFPLARALHGYG